MAVVVDANVVVVLATNDLRRSAADSRFRSWLETGEDVHAPVLLSYEVASSLTRLASTGAITGSQIEAVWQTILQLPITYHALDTQGPLIVATALQLGRQSAYDAAYIVLAQQLGAELWTFDGPLARNAAGHGFPVRLIT